MESELKLQLQLLMQPALFASGAPDIDVALAAAAASVASGAAAAGVPVMAVFEPWYDVVKGRYRPIKVRGWGAFGGEGLSGGLSRVLVRRARICIAQMCL